MSDGGGGVNNILSNQVNEAIRIIRHLQDSTCPESMELKTCVKLLLEICQLALQNKKLLISDSDRKHMCNCVSTIKRVTPKFTQCFNNLPSTKIKLSEYSYQLIECVQSVATYFEISFDMDPVRMLKHGDTLYFDFKLTKLPNDTRLKKKNLSLSGDQDNHEFQSMGQYRDSPRSPEVNSLNLLDHNSEMVTTATMVMQKAQKINLLCPKEDKEYLKTLKRNLSQAMIEYDASTTNLLANLQDTAMRNQLKDDGRVLLNAINKLKEFLARHSSNAFSGAASLIKNASNNVSVSPLLKSAYPLTDSLKNFAFSPKKDFAVSNYESNQITFANNSLQNLYEASSTKNPIRNPSTSDSVLYKLSKHSTTNLKGSQNSVRNRSSTDLDLSKPSKHSNTNIISKTDSHLHKGSQNAVRNRSTTDLDRTSNRRLQLLPDRDIGNPMTIECFELKTNELVESCLSNDARTLEEVINVITECQDTIKSVTEDVSCREDQTNDSENLSGSTDSMSHLTRQLIRSVRESFLHDYNTESALSKMKSLISDWCNMQTNTVARLWDQLGPWAHFTGRLFSKQLIGNDKHVKRKFDTTIHEFKEIDRQLHRLVKEYFEHDIDITKDENNEERQASKVKMRNLSLELKSHSVKVLKITQLHSLDGIEPKDWLHYGPVLLKWSNCVKQLLQHLSIATRWFSSSDQQSDGFDQNTFTKQHKEMRQIGERCIQSCQDQEMKMELTQCVKDLKTIYEVMTTDNTFVDRHVEDVHKNILYARWKIKAFELQQLVDRLTEEVSPPINTLLAEKKNSTSTTYHYADVLKSKIERIRIHACLAVDKSTSRSGVHEAIETMDELNDVTEQILTNHRKIKEHGKNHGVESTLNFLRLQWLSLSNYLVFHLRTLPQVRYSAISGIMRHLMTKEDVSNPNEFKEVLNEKIHPTETLHTSISRRFFTDHPQTLTSPTTTSENVDSLYETWADYSESSEHINDAAIHRAFSPNEFTRADCQILNGSGSSKETGTSQDVDVKNQDVLEAVLHRDTSCDGNDWTNMTHQQNIPEIIAPLVTKSRPSNSTKPPVSPKPLNYRVNRLKSVDSNNNTSESNDKYDDVSISPRTSSISHVGSTHKSIAAAAHILHKEADQWEDENNSIVKVVKLMATQMYQMGEFSKGRGTLKSKDDLVSTAKAVAANAKTVSRFARIIAEHCDDKNCRKDLYHYIELVPTISTQLRIVANVKSVNANDETTDVMLVTNAENLMRGVIGTLKAAEAACVKISNETFTSTLKGDDNCDLAFQWKRKIRMKRAMNKLMSPRSELGLRLLKETTVPSLTDLVLDDSIDDLDVSNP